MSPVLVRAAAPSDRAAWERLYRGYRDFYGKPHDPAVFETVWGWLMDPAHESRGLIAEVRGEPVGIGHFRRFSRPIDGAHGLYLDDLFTAAEARGTGAGSAILQRLAEIAAEEGATMVRWITAESNATARSLYDGVATQTPWVTYDLAPAQR
ncbi:GNAT family N-acetyltransferase [Leucobacter luti]|uniref:GNAT family N-acetyltransferase n=1 Tax=Leucobacter luti TaxID=340320 RepID=UPI00104DB8C0|nr:GNAT family N-acetyltransferase [Leucobacter luti]MCW2289421.1 GNAT superfamily N-acetyltransferase [Leucobacter luti]QYM74810.1 GNAT family N-acetyltransferase [Leucobacter luti]TCK39980.1 acetyltransferase (GNAT) family protein [Leucobacter luti]